MRGKVLLIMKYTYTYRHYCFSYFTVNNSTTNSIPHARLVCSSVSPTGNHCSCFYSCYSWPFPPTVLPPGVTSYIPKQNRVASAVFVFCVKGPIPYIFFYVFFLAFSFILVKFLHMCSFIVFYDINTPQIPILRADVNYFQLGAVGEQHC